MSTTAVVVLVVIVAVVLLAVAFLLAHQRRRRQELQGTFGPEYDRTLEEAGSRRAAERELAQRREEHDQLDIRPLSAASRERYTTRWSSVQERFVDQPTLALSEADLLLTQLMDERGYPTGDVDEQARMLSVEHTHVLDSYRAGHAVEQDRTADTEQVRQAMLHFRTVFEELLSDSEPDVATEPGRTEDRVRR
ncbi:MAG: hypothetical protein WCD35_12235 [Mycobacteriales bacterium]